MKPYSESCTQNQQVILNVIKPLLVDKSSVLEIGSGTGQHAVFFAHQLPHLTWHTSDRAEYHDGILQWLEDAGLNNTRPPLRLDVSQDDWPHLDVDAIFSANAVHIMAWENVRDFFEAAGEILPKDALFILYGPFNYNGQYSSESNARFDQWLKQRDPNSGIRDFEALNQLALNAAFKFKKDIEMPANNRILVWKKLT